MEACNCGHSTSIQLPVNTQPNSCRQGNSIFWTNQSAEQGMPLRKAQTHSTCKPRREASGYLERRQSTIKTNCLQTSCRGPGPPWRQQPTKSAVSASLTERREWLCRARTVLLLFFVCCWDSACLITQEHLKLYPDTFHASTRAAVA